MAKKKKIHSQKKMLPLLFVLVGMLAVLGFFKISSVFKMDTKNAPEAETKMLTGLAQVLDIQPEIRDAIYWDWIQDEKRLPLTGKEFIMGTVNINGIGQYKKLAGQDLDQVTFENLKPIQGTTNAYFKSKGFKTSKQNNRMTDIEVSNTEYTGFEKGEMKCLYRLSETTDPFGSFFCGKIDQTQLDQQTQFLPMFQNEFDQDAFAGFRVDRIEGKYATGAFYNSSMGYQWIAEKEPNGWKMVWNGNEPPLCSKIEPMGIPKSIYGMCYDQ